MNLPASRRYEHFIKQVADADQVWALKDESGWLLLGHSVEAELFPVWPHERYATEYASAQHSTEVATPIPLDVWLQEWLPKLARDGVSVAVFPLPNGAAIPVSVDMLDGDIRRELERYE